MRPLLVRQLTRRSVNCLELAVNGASAANLARPHAAKHLLHEACRRNRESEDGERSGRGSKLHHESIRISTDEYMRLVDADERCNRCEEKKEGEEPLHPHAHGRALALLLFEEGHGKRRERTVRSVPRSKCIGLAERGPCKAIAFKEPSTYPGEQ